MIATCNLCKKDPGIDPFQVPWDDIGIELMKAHIAEQHPTEDFKGEGNLVSPG